MSHYGKNGNQRNQMLPTELSVFNYGNVDNIFGYNSFFSGRAAGGNIVPDNKLVLTNDNSKLLFAAGFNGGFNTLYDWVGVGRSSGVYNLLPESGNLSFIDGGNVNNSLTANLNAGRLEISTDSASANGVIYSWQSRNPLKLDNSGSTFAFKQGVFRHIGFTNNAYAYAINIESPITGNAPFAQADWNIDSFGANPALNPSGITLDAIAFMKLQTLVFQFFNNEMGDFRFGFLIENVIYFAHEGRTNNQDGTGSITQQIPFGNTNLPFKEEIEVKATEVVRRVGMFNDIYGVWFSATMDKTSDPTLVTEQYSHKTTIFNVGSGDKDYYEPFVASTGETLVDVLQADVNRPIISVRSLNKTIWTFDKIQLTASGPDQNYGCYIQVVYNGFLTGDTFAETPNSISEVTYDLTASSISSGYVLYSGYIYANQDIDIQKNDLYKVFVDKFSKKAVYYFDGTTPQVSLKDDTLSVVATPISTMPALSSLNVGVSVVGGEVR